MLRVGDAILENGEAVEITAFNWRSVSGRKLDGTAVVFPNARIIDRTIEILPGDRPVRVETVFAAPITVAPQLVSDLVAELVADLAEVDDDQPVVVVPIAFDPEKALAQYRVRYWIHDYADRSDLGGEVLRGVWYALQREGVPWPLSIMYDTASRSPPVPIGVNIPEWPEVIAAALAEAHPHPDLDAVSACRAQEIASLGVALHYSASERIVLPSRVRGQLCLLVRGSIYEVASEFTTLPRPARLHTAAGRRPAIGLSRRIRIKRISDQLADAIGPYAEMAVRRAAGEAYCIDGLGAIVADEIADPALRRAFLAETVPPEQRHHGPGFVLRAKADDAGHAASDSLLRAAEACTFVAIPPSVPGSHAAA